MNILAMLAVGVLGGLLGSRFLQHDSFSVLKPQCDCDNMPVKLFRINKNKNKNKNNFSLSEDNLYNGTFTKLQ